MSVPYTFGTNTYAQSGQLDANFAALNSGLSNIDASQITTGTLPIARGGTGATTAPGALASLGAAPATGGSYVSKAGDTMTGALTINPGYVYTIGNGNTVSFDDWGGASHYYWYCNSNVARLGSSSAGADRLTVDANGNLIITGATATKASGTTWANPSSRDIKQDIKPYDKGLQAVLALNPVTYRFDEDSGFDPTDTHIGLVHDETAHMPEMHRKARIGAGPDSEGREVDALDCSAILFALINSVKTLTARIVALENR